MRLTLSKATLLLLAACGQQESPPPATNDVAAAPVAPEAPKAVPLLEGQWRVATIDGRPVGAGSAMTASFAGGKVSVVAGCLRRAWTYTQKGNILSFTADPGGGGTCDGRLPSVEQEATYAALDKAAMAIFAKDGREASLSGMGGNLTLERR